MCGSPGGVGFKTEWPELESVPAESVTTASSDVSTRRGGRAARPSSRRASSVASVTTSSSRTPRVRRSTSSRLPGKVYAPSQTSVFLRCPRLWDLSRRWDRMGGWTPHLSVGSAIHAGIERFYLNQSISSGKSDPVGDALRCLRAEVENAPGMGLGEWTWEGLAELVERGVTLACATDLLEGGELVGLEVCLTHPGCPNPVPGECEIADFVHRSPQGLVITDHKTSIHKETKWVGKALDETATEWQFWHYAWRGSAYYGEPVVMVRKHLIVLGPKAKAYLHPIATPVEQVKAWYESARGWWRWQAEVDSGAVPAPQNFTACRDFGGCPFFNGCHDLAGDERAFGGYYVRKEGR